jgi:signal transduction histidine kinase
VTKDGVPALPCAPAEAPAESGQDAAIALDHALRTIRILRRANAALDHQLAAARRLETLGHLAGGMAHDFSNVLQALVAIVSMLKRDPGDRDRVLHLAAMLERATARGTAITGRLLAYGRSHDIGYETVDPAVLLPHLCDSLQPTMPDITLDVRVATGVPSFIIDRSQLEMTLINLANNARDAMAATGGRIILSADRADAVPDRPDLACADGFIHLSVADTGTGMDAATLAQAAEPFFTTKPPGQGTGLGLALAFRFCREYGGTLTIDSAPGAGTTIHLYLPAGGIAGDPPERFARFGIPGPLAILRESEPVVRDGLRAALLARGFRVLDAGSAADTPAIPPDVLITDITDDEDADVGLIRDWRLRFPGLPVLALMAGDRQPQPLPDGVLILRKPVSPADVASLATDQYMTSPPFGDKVAPT